MCDGSFIYRAVAPTRDVSQWLREAIASPFGRATLLDPDARKLAIGATVPEGADALAAMVTTYKFHESDDHTADVNRMFNRIVRARKRLGLPPPKRLGPLMEPMSAALAEVIKRKQTPAGALQQVMQWGTRDLRLAMRGYQIEAVTLDALEVPEDVLRAPELILEIGVTHHKPDGAAWAQYVILIVYVDPGQRV